ncbi:MAG: flagellar basal body L-ring protein FlgH [Vicinamibacterales bacterium]|nr:flagellar basal body L-ring protein FlgH [Vicinamibacterales bacterium]
MNRKIVWSAVIALTVGLAAPAAARQDTPANPEKPAKPADSYDVLFQRYLEAARTGSVTPATAPVRVDWLAGLTADPRARGVNDLLTVHVVEAIAASGSAGSTLGKNSSAGASVGSFFGLPDRIPGIDPSNLAGTSAKSDFKGSGVTNRSGALTAVMTVRVSEVLPNGDLVLEGAREIDINGDRQIVVLTGVVRVMDVPTSNVVPSTAIGQLRIRYFGRGLMRDNLQPGWLIRILNKIF